MLDTELQVVDKASTTSSAEGDDDQHKENKPPPRHTEHNQSQNSHPSPARLSDQVGTLKETYRKLDDEENELKDHKDSADNSAARSAGVSENGGRQCCAKCRSATFQVYASHFLSSWGDRMWMFAGGLFLLEVTPGSLRLAAVYGAALALTVIVCGAPVGRWIDRTSRLTAARLSLSIQNLMVCVCAGLLVMITTQRHLFSAWNGWSLIIAEIFVIVSACVAQIGTLGSKLAIEKDWILVICGKDETRLSRMNSVLRTVDLSTEVFAPVIVGAVMTGFGMSAGGIVIAVWNVGSLFVEYGLLHHLYYSNPDLQTSKVKEEDKQEAEESQEDSQNIDDIRRKNIKTRSKILERLVLAWGAWLAYMRHPIRNAGLGLCLLYMTVLAFDNYSRAFVFDSGVPETVLGILTAVASLFGIFGSLAFPLLRSKIGVNKTGMVGFGSETLCLTLCVASVFAPGSPFDASALLRSEGENSTQIVSPTRTTPEYFIMNTTAAPSEDLIDTAIVNINGTKTVAADDINITATEEVDYTFIILLLSGIITSRFGLWIADLTVTQILQEGVEDGQRGAINGVQSSLNQSLDLMRSILLIILPRRETFGFLIILSFLFVTIGWITFGVYAHHHPAPSTTNAAVLEDEQLRPSLA